jgi:hypothetical protein
LNIRNSCIATRISQTNKFPKQINLQEKIHIAERAEILLGKMSYEYCNGNTKNNLKVIKVRPGEL